MVEGESGIMSVCPSWAYPKYEPSKRRLTWPNGALAITYSADEPDRLRGPQHDAIWVDEPASWRRPETWDMAMFGLRLGNNPRAIVTGTPRRTKLIKDLIANPRCAMTRGTTYENLHNLAPVFREQILIKYEGTMLGRQELNAELLDDVEGALWKHALIEENRVTMAPQLTRVIVGVDPAISNTDTSDETGIVIVGIGCDGHLYIIGDSSGRFSPDGWARRAVGAYRTCEADKIVGEANQGGDMVQSTIKTVDKVVPVKKVYASRGKRTRAEPIVSYYEQGRAHHVGQFSELEDQMCSWVPGEDSPDRMDALVWAATELIGGGDVWQARSYQG